MTMTTKRTKEDRRYDDDNGNDDNDDKDDDNKLGDCWCWWSVDQFGSGSG